MTDLHFTVVDIAPEPYAVTPILMAHIAITDTDDAPVHAVALRCQVRIEPVRRTYSDDEATGLIDLFGPRERWSTTQHTFLWQHTAAVVPGFTGSTVVQLPMECTYDFEVRAAKYLLALGTGSVPLQFLFSGTIFTQGERGFSVQQVPWDREEHVDMPVSVWRELIRLHYPGTGWLRLTRDNIDALAAYRSARGLLGFDDAITELLAGARELR
ncbi:DUF6084 family protein [Mycolicibacterium austroafricanum]|jgi:hypothetical protein|uniref:DUF6084 family protein n=1 Tax=Mycolicibacterium austroafricanum TaxID=39687 RepID=A0ABT8HNY1_MYCAO|nr:DUF6084 family protein [Mycolicibacterium austroafricanum]MDN4522476.1 DUF6084 family protein [Mycolicibacterium austroafricanum]QRZ09008.1 hypothetical protein JN090_11175 [Mycolicibacterium austroafricanum]QZT70784.1 DUF6084 family protein [Mycolicibacterium austroafricanum]